MYLGRIAAGSQCHVDPIIAVYHFSVNCTMIQVMKLYHALSLVLPDAFLCFCLMVMSKKSFSPPNKSGLATQDYYVLPREKMCR